MPGTAARAGLGLENRNRRARPVLRALVGHEEVLLSGLTYVWMGPTPTLTLPTSFRAATSTFATASSPLSDAYTKRPSGEKATCAGDCPTSTSATFPFVAVSMTLRVVPATFAT